MAEIISQYLGTISQQNQGYITKAVSDLLLSPPDKRVRHAAILYNVVSISGNPNFPSDCIGKTLSAIYNKVKQTLESHPTYGIKFSENAFDFLIFDDEAADEMACIIQTTTKPAINPSITYNQLLKIISAEDAEQLKSIIRQINSTKQLEKKQSIKQLYNLLNHEFALKYGRFKSVLEMLNKKDRTIYQVIQTERQRKLTARMQGANPAQSDS